MPPDNIAAPSLKARAEKATPLAQTVDRTCWVSQEEISEDTAFGRSRPICNRLHATKLREDASHLARVGAVVLSPGERDVVGILLQWDIDSRENAISSPGLATSRWGAAVPHVFRPVSSRPPLQ